jgi:hypothetical protein
MLQSQVVSGSSFLLACALMTGCGFFLLEGAVKAGKPAQTDMQQDSSPPREQGTRAEPASHEESVPKTEPAAQQNLPAPADDNRSPGNTAAVPCFQLGTVHNEIWAPVKPVSVLYGYAAATEPEPAPMLLKGGVRYLDKPESTLATIQHMAQAHFLSNFTRLTPQLDQDVFHELKAQLTRTRPMLNAAIQKAELEMKAELAHSRPAFQGKIDLFAPRAANALVPRFDLQANKPDPLLAAKISRDRLEMERELSRPQLEIPSFSVYRPTGRTDLSKEMSDALSRARKPQKNTDLKLAERELQAELTYPKPVTPDLFTDLKLRAERRKKETEAQIAAAKPALEAVYTRLRQPAQLSTLAQLGLQSRVGEKAEIEKLISWDRWYAEVAKAYEPRLLRALRKRGNPSGSNTVSISVWPDLHLVVSLSHKSNPAFDAATLEAYKSLDGDSCLRYPQGSQRQKITFLIDNLHKSSRAISGVTSQTCRGDHEVQVVHGN